MLRLIANDADDLKIVASALQDAILQVGGVRYDPVSRAVTMRLSRFRHEAQTSERVECGLRVDGVMALQSQGIERDEKDAFMVLLDARFEETDAPSGNFDLVMAGGGALRMMVEGLDLTLADTGKVRATRAVPDHNEA